MSKSKYKDFKRWTREWSMKRGVGFPDAEECNDRDFQDFFVAACEHLGIDSVGDQEVQLANVVYNMCLDFSEDHAQGVDDANYRK